MVKNGLALCLKEINFECNFDGKKRLRLKGIIEQCKVFISVVPFLNVYFWLKKGTMGMKVWAYLGIVWKCARSLYI